MRRIKTEPGGFLAFPVYLRHDLPRRGLEQSIWEEVEERPLKLKRRKSQVFA